MHFQLLQVIFLLLKNRINEFFRKGYRRGLVTQLFDINTAIDKSANEFSV